MAPLKHALTRCCREGRDELGSGETTAADAVAGATNRPEVPHASRPTRMPPDSGLVSRVADALAARGERAVRQKNVFGGRGFLFGMSTFAIVWDDSLIVKAARSEYDALRAEPGVTPFAPDGEKPMSTWLVVSPDVIADDPELMEWIARGLRGVR